MVALCFEQVTSSTETPSRISQEAASKLLSAAVTALPEREQLVLAMVYLESLNTAEAALVLDMVPSEFLHLHASAVAKLRTAAKW